MTVLLSLIVAGTLSWLLRVAFITILPASRLPPGVHRILEHGVVAIPAALVATSLAGQAGAWAVIVPSPSLLALVAAGVVAWRTSHLAGTVATGVGVFWLIDLAWTRLLS